MLINDSYLNHKQKKKVPKQKKLLKNFRQIKEVQVVLCL